jgi:hypothetical protein
MADAQALASRPPEHLAAYRVARVAEWSQPRYALDRRFVRLTLIVDAGEDQASGRWQPAGDYASSSTRPSRPCAAKRTR